MVGFLKVQLNAFKLKLDLLALPHLLFCLALFTFIVSLELANFVVKVFNPSEHVRLLRIGILNLVKLISQLTLHFLEDCFFLNNSGLSFLKVTA